MLACDSTNVFNPHPGRSEASLTEPIGRLMREAEGLVVATTFASNVARLKTLAEAGRAAGRHGRRARPGDEHHAEDRARRRGARRLPRDARRARHRHGAAPALLVLATGSQGERRAATAQLAQGRYMGLELKPGDTFLFSSKTIPGNEVAVARILNQLSREGRHRRRRQRRALPRLRPRQPARPRDAAGAAAAEDAGADARRAPPPRRPRGARRRARHRGGGGAERHACST